MTFYEQLAEFHPKKGVALQHQITDFLRQLILRKALPDNLRLPPNRELAKRLNTNYFTIQMAFAELVRAGLIVRRPRLGTFVRYPSKALKKIGLYHAAPLYGHSEESFVTKLHMLVYQMLSTKGVTTFAYFDDRSFDEHKKAPKTLIQAIRKQEIQGVIATFIHGAHASWLNNLSVPSSAALDMQFAFSSSVELDIEELCELAVSSLSQSGVTQAGIITHVPPKNAVIRNLPEIFGRKAAAKGIEVRPEWIVTPKALRRKRLEATGYELFQDLWRMKQKPNGIFIYPDVVAKGVTAAILEKAIDVPKELVVVAHKNTETDFFTPLPIQWVEVQIMDFAKALIRQIEQQIQGRPCTPLLVKSKLSTDNRA